MGGEGVRKARRQYVTSRKTWMNADAGRNARKASGTFEGGEGGPSGVTGHPGSQPQHNNPPVTFHANKMLVTRKHDFHNPPVALSENEALVTDEQNTQVTWNVEG